VGATVRAHEATAIRPRRAILRLSGLAAAATLTAACATAPDPARSALQTARVEQGATDEVLAGAVVSALNADPVYYYRHVDVSVDNGVADLSGFVWGTDAIYRARQIASTVPGITAVRTSQLQLERNGRDTGPAR
jgi:osmotically-inducible protein OsmY